MRVFFLKFLNIFMKWNALLVEQPYSFRSQYGFLGLSGSNRQSEGKELLPLCILIYPIFLNRNRTN